MALNAQRKVIVPIIYRRTVSVLMTLRQSKADSIKKYHYKPTTPEERAENTLKRDFNANKPKQKWCTDITEKKTPGLKQKIFLCTIVDLIDLYDRYPVGHALRNCIDTALVQAALDYSWNKEPYSQPSFITIKAFNLLVSCFSRASRSWHDAILCPE